MVCGPNLSLIGNASDKVGQTRSVFLVTCFSFASIRCLKICVIERKTVFVLLKDE